MFIITNSEEGLDNKKQQAFYFKSNTLITPKEEKQERFDCHLVGQWTSKLNWL